MRPHNFERTADLWEVLEDCTFHDEVAEQNLNWDYTVTVNVSGKYVPARIFCRPEDAHPAEYPEAEAEAFGSEYAVEALAYLTKHVTLTGAQAVEFLRVAERYFDAEIDYLCAKALEAEYEEYDRSNYLREERMDRA